MSMRLIFMTSLTMIAFAVNSILNRLAVDSEIIDPSSFAMVRVSSGALVLWVILNVKSSEPLTFEKAQFLGALSLAAYIIGFSRNPSLQQEMFKICILGFALTEAMALFALMMAFLILFTF